MQTDEIPYLAALLKEVLIKIRNVLAAPAYNFIMHSSPVAGDEGLEYYHWHIELIPKLTRVAGFEWGSGFYVVSIPPEVAAKYLREK